MLAPRFRVCVLGFRVSAICFRVWGSGFRPLGLRAYAGLGFGVYRSTNK